MPFYFKSERGDDKSDNTALSKPVFGGFSHKGTQNVILIEEAKNSSDLIE